MKRKITTNITYRAPAYYGKVLLAGFFFWVMENVYFGWNATAQSGAERLADVISLGLVWYGLIGSIALNATKEVFKSLNLSADIVDTCESSNCHCGKEHSV